MHPAGGDLATPARNRGRQILTPQEPLDGNDLEQARKAVLKILRRTHRAGVEGLGLNELLALRETVRYFKSFETWGVRRRLAVIRAAQGNLDPDMVEATIAAVECLAAELRVLLTEADDKTIIFLTSKGLSESEDDKP